VVIRFHLQPVIERDHIPAQTDRVMASSQPTRPPWRAPRAVPPALRASPAPDPEPTPAADAGEARLELLRRAEALEIPWRRILQDEIQAEQAQRRHASDVAAMPLAMRMAVLSHALLTSWRVRDEIQALSTAARATFLPGPVRQLRQVFRRLVGKPEGHTAALAAHLWLAHERVLLLQRVCRAARRCRGTTAERMASICAATRCSFDDAAWALCGESAARRGHALDASIAKAREEGFQIPRAASEARAFADLRRIARASGAHRPRRAAGSAAVAAPHRVALRDDAI